MPVDLTDLMDDYGRRSKDVGTTHKQNLGRLASWTQMGARFGGVGAGVGAAAAGIAALMGKRAPTARTDFAVNDARDAISRAYQQYWGRQASEQDLQTHLQGQGWKPGDRWVGEQGLTSVLSAIANGEEARNRAAAMPTQGMNVPGSGLKAGQTGMAMTPQRQQLMDSLRQGTPNRAALLAQLKG
jgi:hypothetical protein